MTQNVKSSEPESTSAQANADTLRAAPEDERDLRLEAAGEISVSNASEIEEAKVLDSQPGESASKQETMADVSQQPEKQVGFPAARAATETQAGDPVESEPYRWHECTVGINIQLIPDGDNKEHYETAIIGVRTHNDAPIIKRVAAKELLPLPECIKELIREMREQLPARAEHRAERLARARAEAKAAKTSVVKTHPGKSKVKPGRHIAAGGAGGQKETVEQEALDDDLFSAPQAGEQTVAGNAAKGGEDFADDFATELEEEAAGGSNTHEPQACRLHAQTAKPTVRRDKQDKRGRSLKEKHAAAPQEQMSLIG